VTRRALPGSLVGFSRLEPGVHPLFSASASRPSGIVVSVAEATFSEGQASVSTKIAYSKTESKQIQLVRIGLSVWLEAMLKVQMGSEFTNFNS
jgi:hypothetical protein